MKQVNRFEMVPTGNVPRTKMQILSGHKTSMNAGKLTPVYADIDVLPHQTKKLSVDFVLRGTTFKTPIMDYFFIDFFAFYTCNRILLDSWVEIMGENKTGAWAQNTSNLFVPQMNFAGQPVTKGNLANYLGIPIGYTGKISLLPFRNYQLIWNEWFRDQNVVAPIQISKDSNEKRPADFNNLELLPVYKIADYFTTALPEPQKGLPVMTPLGESAPIRVNTEETVKYPIIKHRGDNSSPDTITLGVPPNGVTENGSLNYNYQAGSAPAYIDPNNTLIADLSQAVGATINAQRLAWQIQGILQMDARGGTRYFEICKNHFKVRIPDNQWRPELIGSKRIPININQVVQNSESGTTPLGTTGAFCHVSGHVEFPTKSFVEHGEYFILACIRQQHTYQQGIAKPWFKRQRFDFYLPALAHLGEQPIYQREIFATGTDEDWRTFGFAEAWSEYRYKPSIVTGELSSLYDQPLDIWHLGDYYEDAPVLSDEFLKETPEYLDRCIQIPSATQDQFIIDMLFTDDCVLPMPMYSVPSMVDHF